jgi:nucleoside diphosphate kinase
MSIKHILHEVTLAIIKPDLTRRLTSEQLHHIRTAVQAKGLTVRATRDIPRLTRAQTEQFYGSHEGRFFFPRLVQYMSSGPLTCWVLQGPRAITAWRDLIGPTHVTTARSTRPDSLRAQFAFSDTKNSFHGSDSVDSAMEEIKFFFPNLDVNALVNDAQQ